MTFDLAVVGGGITGTGLARLAARNGLRVVVLERGDLMSGASSRSSHMLHGGLRYLEKGRVRLVREALRERDAVARLAPALSRPVTFLAPLWKGDRVGPLRLRAGLALYELLGGRHAARAVASLDAAAARAFEPGLRVESLRGGALYADVVMDDALLGIAVASDAAAHGAAFRTGTPVIGVRRAGTSFVLDVHDARTGTADEIEARVVVVAAGASTDEVRAAFGGSARRPILRPSRGTHLVYPALTAGHGLVPLGRDGRVLFAVPFGGRTLVGTTEVEVASPPAPRDEDAAVLELVYLRESLGRVLPAAADVRPVTAYSGLRPLLRAEGSAGDLPREHAVVEENGVFYVAGGKWTTFRVMARDALTRVLARLGRDRRIVDPLEPLPVPPPESAPLEVRVGWAVRSAGATCLEDVLRRRTHLWLETAPDAARVARAMAPLLGWDAGRETEEVASWSRSVTATEARLDEAGFPPRKGHT